MIAVYDYEGKNGSKEAAILVKVSKYISSDGDSTSYIASTVDTHD